MNVNTHRDTDVDNTAQAMLASAGYLDWTHVHNPNGETAFFHVYDALAADVTVGTTAPKQSYWVPANGSFDLPLGQKRMYFRTGITYAATKAITGNDDPTTGLILNAWYS